MKVAVICANGIIKFYNSDGSRCENHPSGFYRPKFLNQLKKDFIVKID